MTRLISGWIADIEDELDALDAELTEKCGMDLKAVACRAAGLTTAEFDRRLAEYSVAAVSLTSGLGVIGRFAGSVAAICRHLGADVFVPEANDLEGFFQGVRRGAGIFFAADDDRFLAVNCTNGSIGENDFATALGYCTLLELMGGVLRGAPVLVLGYGRVGSIAADILSNRGAAVSVYDKRPETLENCPYPAVSSEELNRFPFVFDATNEGEWLHPGNLCDGVYMAAPGVPFSLDAEALKQYGNRVHHDVLQLGTAVMLALAVSG